MMAEEEPQHVFGDVGVNVDPQTFKTGSESMKTVDDLVKGMREIVAAVILYRAEEGFDTEADDYKEKSQAIFKRAFERFPDYAKEFPVIFRWVASSASLCEKAFRAYIKTNHKPFWKDREEMLVQQVEYLVYTYRIENRKCSGARLDRYRQSVKKQVLEDKENFDKAVKEAEEICEANEEMRLRVLREALMESAQRAFGRAPADET